MNTVEPDTLLPLIHQYLDAVDNCCSALAACAGTTALLRASRDGRLPRRGHVHRRFSFRFHGIGCAFLRGRIVVDVDFVHDGVWDAFDAWRLRLFAASIGADLPVTPELIAALEAQGAVVPVGTGTISNHLKRLAP